MNETQKMMKILDENYKKVRAIRLANEKARQERKEKKARNKRMIVVCALIGMLCLVGLYITKENELKGCMENGYSENFCKYAGE